MRRAKRCGIWLVVAALCVTLAGCATNGKGLTNTQIATLGAAGMGALLGQLIGVNTVSTLIGTGVGLGVGYIIGNEMDKEEAQKKKSVTADDLGPFVNTTWQIISITPMVDDSVTSRVGRFHGDGTLTTTAVHKDGRTVTENERYRVVAQTLIINKDNYVINARFRIEGDRMYVDTGRHSVVLQRL